jgi:phosphatidate phosphatase PAH1
MFKIIMFLVFLFVNIFYSGAIDIIAIIGQENKIRSSPFYVRIGLLQVLFSPSGKKVKHLNSG